MTQLSNEQQAAIVAAAEKLVRCKGRYHSEQNYRALAALFGVTVPDLPPLAAEAHEPYGYVHQWIYEDCGSCGLSNDHEAYAESDTHIPLYRHPPTQAVAVPDVSDLEKVLRFIEGLPVPTNGAAKNGKRLYDFIVACRAAMLNAEPVSQPYTLPDDTKRLDWLDAQNKRLNEYHGTSYGWKFDANFQRNAMMLNDSNYPVMNVRQAIDEAMRTAPLEPTK